MKTYSAKPLEVNRTWWLIDAEGQTVGRLATLVASVLRGKHKPQYTAHVDTGDFVVVINAEKVVITGKKAQTKLYRRHTGYPGGLREVKYLKMLATHPERILETAVWGMLPHNTLGRQQMRKLHVYAGPQHPHAAQVPQPLEPPTVQKFPVATTAA
jgi:large subunit ribosomal protein L13